MHICACGHELGRHLGGNICGNSPCGCRGFQWNPVPDAPVQRKPERVARRISMPGGF